MGLVVLAGHGLDYRNIDGIAALNDIEELNIGHSIVARAALVGLDRAVREMVALMAQPRR
jgi:pyridoxine 5-phosphate synthase